MKRIIVDHKKLTQELAQALIKKYPQGYGDEDIITFKNALGEWVEAVELCAGETCYLVKISQSLSNLMADFEILHTNEDTSDILVGEKEYDGSREGEFSLEE